MTVKYLYFKCLMFKTYCGKRKYYKIDQDYFLLIKSLPIFLGSVDFLVFSTFLVGFKTMKCSELQRIRYSSLFSMSMRGSGWPCALSDLVFSI